MTTYLTLKGNPTSTYMNKENGVLNQWIAFANVER